MPNPKRRHSSARRDKRRANWKLTPPTLVPCPNPRCEEQNIMRMPHHVCPNCGTYNGRQVVSVRRGQPAEA